MTRIQWIGANHFLFLYALIRWIHVIRVLLIRIPT